MIELEGRILTRRYAQARLNLNASAKTPEAKALIAYCLNEIVLPSLTGQQRRPSSVTKIERALEGLWGGLLLAKGFGWLRRPMSNDSFTAEPVSARQFRKVRDAMHSAGLIASIDAYFDRPTERGAETRLAVSKAGQELAAAHGIDLHDIGLHFAAGSEDQKGKAIS